MLVHNLHRLRHPESTFILTIAKRSWNVLGFVEENGAGRTFLVKWVAPDELYLLNNKGHGATEHASQRVALNRRCFTASELFKVVNLVHDRLISMKLLVIYDETAGKFFRSWISIRLKRSKALQWRSRRWDEAMNRCNPFLSTPNVYLCNLEGIVCIYTL